MSASALPSLLTMEQVAEYLAVHIRTVRRLIKRGKLVAPPDQFNSPRRRKKRGAPTCVFEHRLAARSGSAHDENQDPDVGRRAAASTSTAT